MASISELLQYAQAKRRPNPIAQLAQIAIGGLDTGVQAYQAQKKANMDAYKTLIDIQDKMASLEEKKNSNLLTSNMLKSIGVLPFDDQENAIGKSVAGDFLGEGKKPTYPNTTSGKISQLATESLFDKYDVKFGLTGGKTNIEFSTKKKKGERTAGESDARNKQIYKMAEEMAKRAKYERLSQERDLSGNLKYPPGTLLPNQIEASPDEIGKWTTWATHYADGDFSGADSITKQYQAESDPLAGQIQTKKPGLFNVLRSAFGRSRP